MATQFPSLSMFLLLLLAFQEMMPSEAALCEAPSKYFTGLCFSSKNCMAICEKDRFISGKCRRFKCICQKDCNSGGGPGQGPPEEGPPEQGPPNEGPPEQGPPNEGPPEQGPGSGGEPGQGPPDEGPPEQGPGGGGEGPPDEGPPEQGPGGGGDGEEPPVLNRKSLVIS